MASAVQNPLRDRSKNGQYRFPPGFQRNLMWFACAGSGPANPITLFQHLVDKYGDIAHYKIGWNHIVFLNHPDYIREVLVVQNDNFIKERTVRRTKMLLGEGMITAEGAQHRIAAAGRATRVPSPAHPGICSDHGARGRPHARPLARRRAARHRHRHDAPHAERRGARRLFATDLRDEVNELADAINRIMGLYNFLVMLPAAEWLVHVRPPGLAAFVRARKRIDAVVYRMIDAHRKRQADGGSLLDMMLAASPDHSPASGTVAARSGHHDFSCWIRNRGQRAVLDLVSALAESGMRAPFPRRD